MDFEAKETKVKTFPFANISKHQIDHLQKIINHGGIAFVIIAFTSLNAVSYTHLDVYKRQCDTFTINDIHRCCFKWR